MSKEGELRFFAELPADELAQATHKPFGHPERASLMANLSGVLKVLPDPPARILDMGCGTGWTSHSLARCGYEVLGTDISPDAVAIAAQSAPSGCKFEVADFECKQQAAAFDAVLFFDCLHHAERPDLAVMAAYHALRRGGVLVTVEPGYGHSRSPDSIDAMRRYGVTEADMPSILVRRLAKDAGFRRFSTYPIPRNMVASTATMAVYQAIIGRWRSSSITVARKD